MVVVVIVSAVIGLITLQGYLDQAWNYLQNKEYIEAVTDYTRYIDTYSDNAFAFYNRGFAYANLGDDDLAIADYKRAAELDPNYDDPHLGLGNVYYAMEDYDQALAEYQRYIELAANPASSVLNQIVELETQTPTPRPSPTP